MKNILSFLRTQAALLLALMVQMTAIQATTIIEENDSIEQRVIPVFLGYDQRAPIGQHICQESMLKHSLKPVAVTPL